MLETRNDFRIAELGEVFVPGADAEVGLGRGQHDDAVGHLLEAFHGVGCARRRGHDDRARRERPRREHGSVHRRAGRDPVVDEDHGLSGKLRRRLPAPINGFAAYQLRGLARPYGLEIRGVEPERRDQRVVVDGKAAVRDGADRELRLMRRAELPHDEHVERRLECARDLERNGHAAARQAEHDDVAAEAVPRELEAERLAGLPTIAEHLHAFRSLRAPGPVEQTADVTYSDGGGGARRSTCMRTDREVPLDAKLEVLRDPGAFPDAPDFVEIVETHFAWVFLSRRFVYKLKKPIRFHELDVTTLAGRRANCELEVALNRRLAERVYIGVVPLALRDGRMFLEGEGEGEPVEWLVKMHRLPRERMLDHAGRHATVTDTEVVALVDKLASFYARAMRAPFSPAEYVRHLAAKVERYGAQFEQLDVPYDRDLARALVARLAGFVRANAPLFEARAAAGRVVDAHGDLKPEHVYLADDDPQIIDCLEFAAELRLLDTAEEIAFLVLECDRLGFSGVGRRVFEAYSRRCADPGEERVYELYRGVRALVRAWLSAGHLGDDLDAAERTRWAAQTRWYLDAAAAAIAAAEDGP